MKVLLIGEYSRLHNSLKEGLSKLNHSILLIGSGDGFKNYPVDINISPLLLSHPVLTFFTKAIYKLTTLDLFKLETAWRFYKTLPKLKDYDVVQLINENSIKTYPKIEIWFLKRLKKQNKKLYLLSCGTDYVSVKYANDNKFKYSILTPLHQNNELKKEYRYILKYLTKPYYKLHQFLYNTIDGVIASDIDYHLPLQNQKRYKGLIPNPINTDVLNYQSSNTFDPIIIFHGINSYNYIKKGNVFFEEALKIINEKFSEKIKIITSKDLSYKDYMEAYNKCHILLDQVYAYDQGYNALEAMAKGKVVFTGAEQEWLEHYNLKENTVAINALPNAKIIAKQLEALILNPKQILEISKNARAFIEKEHHYVSVANSYLKTWKH